jgi:hypothetical protein
MHVLQRAYNATITTLQGRDILNAKDSQIIEHQPSLRVMILDELASPLISSTFVTLLYCRQMREQPWISFQEIKLDLLVLEKSTGERGQKVTL